MNSPTILRPVAMLAVAVLVAVGTTACTDDATDGTKTARPVSGEITVSAAASLTEPFTALGRQFEADNPGTAVHFNFGASSALAEQLVQGAPADVYASADEASMGKVTAAGLDGEPPVVFARNELTILVERGNPEGIDSLADLASPDLAVVLCAEEVPCGRYSAQALAGADAAVTPRSLEENVKGVVTKVASGEADAGIVYVTDAKAARRDTDHVEIVRDQNVIATYPITTLDASTNPAVAEAFVDLVTSPEGQSVLERFGFLAVR